MVVAENLAFLLESGVTDRDVLAKRLGFTNAVAMERFFFRHKIRPPTRETNVSHYKDRFTYDALPEQPRDIRQQALTCVVRKLQDLDALGEAEELAGMLGLLPEFDAATRGKQLAVG